LISLLEQAQSNAIIARLHTPPTVVSMIIAAHDSDFSTLEITTRSSAKAFPSALRTKRSAIQTKTNAEGPARAKVPPLRRRSDGRSTKNVQIARTKK